MFSGGVNLMEGIIPEETVEEIRIKNDIVSVISKYVDIKKKGKNYQGLCPFHNEKTPSFNVSPDKQLFYCFGCGEGGNVFSFIMKINNLTFPEACEYLADQVRVEIPHNRLQNPEYIEEKENIKKINNLTAHFYHKLLLKSNKAEPAKNYLYKRGLKKETIDRFLVGFAPYDWNLLTNLLLKKGFDKELVVKAGVVGKSSKENRLYDRFRNRIIFPIKDQKGDVIGFGGRVLSDKDHPKYLNSPETPVFNKRKILYGIDLSYKEIRKTNSVLIVEGYMDVIMMHQFGFKNVLAPLGTSFTEDQGRLLKYNAKKIYIAFDADIAGEAAAIRSLELLQNLGLQVRVCNLPEGLDPDDYLNSYGKDKFINEILKRSQPLMYYRLRQAAKLKDIESIEGKKEFVEEVLPLIANLNSAVEQEEYLKMISDWIGTGKNTLEKELIRITNKIGKEYKNKNYKNKDYTNRKKDNQDSYRKGKGQLRAQEELITLMLNYFETVQLVKEYLYPDDFDKKEWSLIVHCLFVLESQGETEFDLSMLMSNVNSKSDKDIDVNDLEKEISRLTFREHPKPEEISINKVIKDCAFKIKGKDLERRKEQLQESLKKIDPGEEYEKYREVLLELQKYIKIEKTKNLNLEGRGVRKYGKE